MVDPAFYCRDGARVAQCRTRLEAVQAKIEEAYRTWEAMDRQ